jgi:rRNA maturation endonuclease Nob1
MMNLDEAFKIIEEDIISAFEPDEIEWKAVKRLKELVKRNKARKVLNVSGAMICRSCGRPKTSNGNFCSYCGQKLIIPKEKLSDRQPKKIVY